MEQDENVVGQGCWEISRGLANKDPRKNKFGCYGRVSSAARLAQVPVPALGTASYPQHPPGTRDEALPALSGVEHKHPRGFLLRPDIPGARGEGGGQPPSAPLPCLCCGSGTGWHLWCPQPPAGLLSTLWGCSLFGGTLQTQVWHGNILQPARGGRALAVLPPWLSPLWGRSILGGQQPPCALWCMQPSHTQPYRCCLGLGGPAGARCHLGLGSSWPRCK